MAKHVHGVVTPIVHRLRRFYLFGREQAIFEHVAKHLCKCQDLPVFRAIGFKGLVFIEICSKVWFAKQFVKDCCV